jgi:hypothetical protein
VPKEWLNYKELDWAYVLLNAALFLYFKGPEAMEKEAQKKQIEESRNAILSQILTPEARERCNGLPMQILTHF